MDAEEMQRVYDFLNACELMLDGNWKEDLDDHDADKLLLEKLQREIGEEDGHAPKYVDDRTLTFEFLRAKWNGRIKLVAFTAETLLENCCDPTKHYLDFLPGTEFKHVANEM